MLLQCELEANASMLTCVCSHYGADSRAGTQQTFDQLVSVVQRLHQVLLLLRSLKTHREAA